MFLACLGGIKWLTECEPACIPAELATYTRIIYNTIRIITPLVLIIIGMFDMAKAVTSKNEDEIKKAQNLLVKKAITGAIVFFLFSIISWMLVILSNTSGETGKSEATVARCLNALFVEKTPASEEGLKEGYTDPTAVCNNYDYTGGVMKIYLNKGSNWFYSCYSKPKNSTKCSGTGSSTYILSNNEEYCIDNFETTTEDNKKIINGTFSNSTKGTEEIEAGQKYGAKMIDAIGCDATGCHGMNVETGTDKAKVSADTCRKACTGTGHKRGVVIAPRDEKNGTACLCINK